MIAFRVTVNGKVLATAGIDGPHVLSAIVSSSAGKQRSGKVPRLSMHLGGLVSGDRPQWRKHLDWLADGRRDLKVGDKVVVEIVEVERSDEPVRQKTALPRPPLLGGRPTGR
jgi:hypothetical protein